MPPITFDVSEGALSALRLSTTECVKQMRVAAALLWYSHDELAIEGGGHCRQHAREFIDELSPPRIPVVPLTAEELQDEVHRE